MRSIITFFNVKSIVLCTLLLALVNSVFGQITIYEDLFTGGNVDGGTTTATAFVSGTDPNNTNWRYTEFENGFGPSWQRNNNEAVLRNTFGVNRSFGGTFLYKAGNNYYTAPGGLYEQTTEFTTVFTNNTDIIEWSFNFRSPNETPQGLTNGGAGFVGGAFVLGLDSPTLRSCSYTTVGYAVTFGDASGGGNFVKLVRVNGGTTDGNCATNNQPHYTFFNWNGTNTTTCMISDNVALTTSWYSVKVQYNPANDEWRLFVRNDGGTKTDPQTLNDGHCKGAKIDATYTGSNLPIMGMYASVPDDGAVRETRWDNLRIKKGVSLLGCPSTTGLCGAYSICTPPTISVQPTNRAICSNGSTTLSVTASAGPYQWQYFNGSSWVNVSNGTPAGFSYTNATTNNLGITTSNAACGAHQFRVVVGSAGCDVLSNEVTVTVLRADRVVPTGPQCSGTQLNFTSCPAGATYSWNVTPPPGTSASPTSGSGQNFSFTPTNNTLTNQTFTVNTDVTFLGLTCPFTFTPNIVPPPEAGTITGTASLCEGATQTFTSNGQTGGLWSSSNTSVATVNSTTGLVTAVGAGTATISYTVNATSPCVGNDVATFVVTVTAAPNAGSISGTASFCETGSATLTSSGNPGGTWSTSNPAVATVNASGLVTAVAPGSATISYTVNPTSPCATPSVATYAITVTAAPEAGVISGTASICFPGTSSLTSNGQIGGIWSTSNPAVATVNASGLVTAVGAGTATISYTVNATSPCVGNDVATFVVTVTAAPNAGSISGTASFCESGSATFTSNGDTGGTWSTSDATIATVNPTTGLVTAVGPGTATISYTVAATSPCTVIDVATFNVTVSVAPDAGTNGTLTVCAGTTPTDAELFASLGGTPDAGGTWSNVGLVYTYTVNAVAPCTGSSSSTVTVTEQAQPNAGTNGTLTVCAGTTPTEAELLAVLGGVPDAGGSWSNVGLIYTYTVAATSPCATPATATVTVTEQVQADAGTNGVLTVCAGITPTEAELFAALNGTPQVGGSWSNVGLEYTYTVSATAPCTSPATATVSVTEQSELDAGTNGTLAICNGTTPSEAELFTALNGTPQAGGIWSNVGLVYTYTINAVAPCTGSSSSTVTVTEQAQPNAGTNGTLTVCAGTTPSEAELFAALGGTPDAGGNWSNVGLIYTYTVAATSPCATQATATVTVTEQAQPNAGTNGTLTVCAGTTPTEAELFAVLGGTPDAGGTWSNVGLIYTYTVAATSPCATPATATVTVIEQIELNSGLDGTLTVCAGTTPTEAELFAALGGTPDAGGSWSNVGLVYTYTVNAVAPCTGSSSSTVTVTEQAQPNAGTNGTLTVCAGTTPTEAELFAALGGTPDAGGTWSNVGLIYTYTVAATSPCATPATATVTVTEQAQPNAGTNGTLTVCAGTTPTEAELFAALGGTPDAGGTWSNVGLIYTYTVAATSPCATPATATVTVTEQIELNSGLDGALTVCAGTTPTEAELFAALGGTPDAGGIWSNVGLVYTYAVNAVAPCTGSSSSTVTVTEQAQPNAGTNGSVQICPGDVVTLNTLFLALGGSPDSGGTWSPEPVGEGQYSYTVDPVSPCIQSAISIVSVTLQNCDIIIPTGFTPGGDGVNDAWNIIGLDELYPLNYVIIFNRWGNEIYRSTEGSYSSMPWDGTYQGKLMPVGSYYYMILPYGDDTNKEDIINGTITIIKE
jgi:gliding motility-associated-like protein